MDAKNKLYFGDNLKILREYVPDASVDLIYLDQPFNSSATYNVLFKEKSGEESAAQITAFEDTWQWSQEAEAVYSLLLWRGHRGECGGQADLGHGQIPAAAAAPRGSRPGCCTRLSGTAASPSTATRMWSVSG